MTSRCKIFAPADSSNSTSRLRLAKSHLSIDGAMSGKPLNSLRSTEAPVIEMLMIAISETTHLAQCHLGASSPCVIVTLFATDVQPSVPVGRRMARPEMTQHIVEK